MAGGKLLYNRGLSPVLGNDLEGCEGVRGRLEREGIYPLVAQCERLCLQCRRLRRLGFDP